MFDPPRRGCAPELIRAAVGMVPSRTAYISCDPTTLTRDLKLFYEFGHAAGSITPLDLFPRTEHVGCVVLLQRYSSESKTQGVITKYYGSRTILR